MVQLTVIIPVFNEEATIDRLLKRVIAAPYADKQIVVVDDGSTDGTTAVLREWERSAGVMVLRHEVNQGKGAAVRTGLAEARGEVTIVQDGDLEYDPQEYPVVVEPILRGECPVVYGSRYLEPTGLRWNLNRVGVVGLNLLVRLLYGVKLTDEATCYKAASTRTWRGLGLKAERFELCAEFTAKVCRLGLPMRDVPIRFSPRSTEEGKKIGWRDILPTVWTLIKWRFKSVAGMKAVTGEQSEALAAMQYNAFGDLGQSAALVDTRIISHGQR